MFRMLMVSLVASTAFLSASSYAVVPDSDSAVSNNWRIIGRELRSLGQVSDAAELSALMDTFLEAATANLDEVPSFMEAGTDLHQEYIKGVEFFISKIEEAKALADAGDVEGAQAVAATFRDIRTESHDFFELEE